MRWWRVCELLYARGGGDFGRRGRGFMWQACCLTLSYLAGLVTMCHVLAASAKSNSTPPHRLPTQPPLVNSPPQTPPTPTPPPQTPNPPNPTHLHKHPLQPNPTHRHPQTTSQPQPTPCRAATTSRWCTGSTWARRAWWCAWMARCATSSPTPRSRRSGCSAGTSQRQLPWPPPPTRELGGGGQCGCGCVDAWVGG